MAKTTGLGGVVSVADVGGTVRTITNDVTNWTLSTPRAIQDVTGIDKSAHEALGLLSDYSVTLNGVMNSTLSNSHTVFSSVPSTSVNRTTTLTPTSATTPSLTVQALFTDYGLTRAATGEVTWSAPGVLADGQQPTWG